MNMKARTTINMPAPAARGIISALILICLIASIPASAPAFASASTGAAFPIEIYLNGSRLVSDEPPVLKDDRTFVPIRVIEEALGFEVSYEDGVVTMRHSRSGANIVMEVGVPSAAVNGQAVDLPVPAFIENGRTMAPVRFISEAMDCHVDWLPGYNIPDRVVIYCPYPTDTCGGKAQITSRIASKSWELDNEFYGTVTIGYKAIVPILAIPGQEGLAIKLNLIFIGMSDDTVKYLENAYAVQLMSGIDETYGIFDDYLYFVVNDDEHLLSININKDFYQGDAYWMPYIISYNLDLEKGILLALKDIFKPGADYENILLQRMAAMCRNDPREYEDVDEPDSLENGSFYISDGDLVLYYHPYKLSNLARGFVEFRIPLASLSEYIRDEYL